MNKTEELLARLEEATSSSGTSYRHKTKHNHTTNVFQNEDPKAGVADVKAISGVGNAALKKYEQQLKKKKSSSEAAKSAGLDQGAANDIKIAKDRGEQDIAENTRELADFLLRASDMLENEQVASLCNTILEQSHALIEAVLGDQENYLDPTGFQKWQNKVLPEDAVVLLRNYSEAVADLIEGGHPGRISIEWGDVVGDNSRATVEGQASNGMSVAMMVQVDHPEAPYVRIEVEEMNSIATQKLTSHNWMAPLGLFMQMVLRAFMQKDFDYSELESFKRV